MRQASLIEKFAPARAIQIRAKLTAKTGRAAGEGTGRGYGIGSAPRAVATDGKNERQEMMKTLQNFGEKKLLKEEREKVVEQPRKIIAPLPNKQAKILALSGLAG